MTAARGPGPGRVHDRTLHGNGPRLAFREGLTRRKVGPRGQQGEGDVSQYYKMGHRTLWNPSSGASRLFTRQVALYQAELGLTSGIGPMEADECQIDPTVFAAFANALLAWHAETRHAVMATLSAGFVATVLALAEKANIDVDWRAAESAESDYLKIAGPHAKEWTAALRQQVRELTRRLAP
ncbi:DUF6086 family protein [Streptomyces sp. NPDC026589]|uniref:DUF6086 family protein n=1 Tax=Streptomyces sp. NPDC026589 TaxID=3155609 RepID=UPI0033FBF3AE